VPVAGRELLASADGEEVFRIWDPAVGQAPGGPAAGGEEGAYGFDILAAGTTQ
jgi:hypothetical protein